MKLSLADLPIRQKLLVVVAASSVGALIVASTSVLALDVQRYRERLHEDLVALSAVVSAAAEPALRDGDRDRAGQVLRSLAAKRDLKAAAIYDRAGHLFAAYQVSSGERLPLAPLAPGMVTTPATVSMATPVERNGARVGSAYVRVGLQDFYRRVRTRVLTVGLVLLAAVLIALLLSSWLQRLVSDPLLELAGIARQVSTDGNYHRRAFVRTRDEVGMLVSAFNGMLAQIERRDADLLTLTSQLEARVQERTSRLEEELAERRRAEDELARRNEALVRANRDLDDFAQIASHDMKEPLRGIHNYANFLRDDYGHLLDDGGRARLDTLARLSARMETLVDALLRFARLGRSELVLEPVDVHQVVADVLDRLAIGLRERGIEIRIPQRLPVIVADRLSVGELFANLVTNAAKYNDKAERWIEITSEERVSAAHGRPPVVVFSVCDNGIGIDPAEQAGVFRIFRRLHGRDDYGGGTGVGLTIVRNIVERHHGRAWIESQPGEGTAVRFTLQQEG